MTDQKLSKADREREARIAAFAAKAQKPQSDDISALLGPAENDPAPAPPAPLELAAPEVPAAPVQAPEPSPGPNPGPEPETAPEPAPAAKQAKPKKEPPPWANAHPKVTVPFMMRLPEDLHMQLTWLKENLPNTSIQKLVRSAIEKEVALLIKENYK